MPPTCSVCLEPFRLPFMTLCGHAFCARCIEGAVRASETSLPCPRCRKPIERLVNAFDMRPDTCEVTPEEKTMCLFLESFGGGGPDRRVRWEDTESGNVMIVDTVVTRNLLPAEVTEEAELPGNVDHGRYYRLGALTATEAAEIGDLEVSEDADLRDDLSRWEDRVNVKIDQLEWSLCRRFQARMDEINSWPQRVALEAEIDAALTEQDDRYDNKEYLTRKVRFCPDLAFSLHIFEALEDESNIALAPIRVGLANRLERWASAGHAEIENAIQTLPDETTQRALRAQLAQGDFAGIKSSVTDAIFVAAHRIQRERKADAAKAQNAHLFEGLPDGWEARVHPLNLEVYYVDHNTRTTTWTRPTTN